METQILRLADGFGNMLMADTVCTIIVATHHVTLSTNVPSEGERHVTEQKSWFLLAYFVML